MSEMDKLRNIAAQPARMRPSTRLEIDYRRALICRVDDALRPLFKGHNPDDVASALAYVIANGLDDGAIKYFEASLTVSLDMKREARNGG